MNDSKFVKWLFNYSTGQTFIVLNGFIFLLILKFLIDLIKQTPINLNNGQIAFIVVAVIFNIIFFLDFLSYVKEDKKSIY